MLLVFILLTIFVLFICVSICCIDATKCSPFKNSTKCSRLKTAPIRNAAKFIERKLSMEQPLAEYVVLNSSLSSYSPPSSRSATLRSEASIVSTV
ncbi:hypothetical protein Q1695_001930 [Nippostrongylus brasiliensis]|nr:hypothetical protein Q1695_001930 [Nippostrongylus brasiliensis]